MADLVLVDGDTALFSPTFGTAMVMVGPGRIEGSSALTVNGKRLCIKGDEEGVKVEGCRYSTREFEVHGVGQLSIKQLSSNHLAKKAGFKGKALLLKGGDFIAEFKVKEPAQRVTPSGTLRDSVSSYNGQGTFNTTNTHFKAE